jgi:hypothetical protein
VDAPLGDHALAEALRAYIDAGGAKPINFSDARPKSSWVLLTLK